MKTYRNICGWCGEEYDIRNYVNGKMSGYRKRYCSDPCRLAAKSLYEYERKERIKAENANKPKGQPGRKRKRDSYDRWQYRFGPSDGKECWGCPMMGWRCRNSEYPPCRTFSDLHKQYIAARRHALEAYT